MSFHWYLPGAYAHVPTETTATSGRHLPSGHPGAGSGPPTTLAASSSHDRGTQLPAHEDENLAAWTPPFEPCRGLKMPGCAQSLGFPCVIDLVCAQKNAHIKPISADQRVRERPGGSARP